MTKSQTWATAAFIATLVSTIGAAILPQLQALESPWNGIASVVGILIAASGAVVMLYNQSLSSAHVSIPVETKEKIAEALNLPADATPKELGRAADYMPGRGLAESYGKKAIKKEDAKG